MADSPAWTQVSFPVKFGGLGIRSAVQLSSLSFLASTISSDDLVSQILPPHLQSTSSHLAEAKSEWSRDSDEPPHQSLLLVAKRC